MTQPTAAQMNCGHALYGPPALCTCGTCDTKDYCQTCGGTGDSEIGALEGECPKCGGTGKSKVTAVDNETKYRNALMWAFDRLIVDGGMTPREQRYTFNQIGNVLLGIASPASAYVPKDWADSAKLKTATQ